VNKYSVYYGWWVLAALFLAGFFVYGGGLYSFVLFLVPLSQEFGWSHAQTGGLVTAFWLSAPLLMVGGIAMRRFGATRLLVIGIILEAIAVFTLAHVSSLTQMYILRALMGFGKILFAATVPVLCARWFDRRFGLALGIAWAGWHVGGMVLVPVTQQIIAQYNWRLACLALSVCLMIFALIPMLWAQRIKGPEQLGLGRDGDPIERHQDFSAAANVGDAISPPEGRLRDVLATSRFWLITLATFAYYLSYGGLLTHADAIIKESGFSSQYSALVVGAMAGVAALGGVAIGHLIDRQPLKISAAIVHVVLILGGIGLLLVNLAHWPFALIIYVVFFGLTVGGADVFFVTLMREQFPRVNVDHLYSCWYFAELITLFLSGIIAGWIFDQSKNYHDTLEVLVASGVVAAVLASVIIRLKPISDQ
jgi:MFS family permease